MIGKKVIINSYGINDSDTDGLDINLDEKTKDEQISKICVADELKICNSSSPIINRKRKIKKHHVVDERSEYTDHIINRLINFDGRVCYIFLRTKKISLREQTTHFQLYRDERPLYHSQVNSYFNNRRIFVYEGISSLKTGQNCNAFIFSTGLMFSIRDIDDISRDLATVRYFPKFNKNRRNLFLTLFDIPECESFIMRSGDPNIEKNVEKELRKYNFIKSIKNNVLYYPKSDRPLISFGKIDKNNLEVHAPFFVSEYAIFALCVSSFMTK